MGSRIWTAIVLYAFTVFGIFLVVVPWSALWDQALLGVTAQPLRALVATGWARGAISGLGGLDLMVAAQLMAEMWKHLRVSEHGPAKKGTDLFSSEK